jgi:hypothetical protein
MEFRPLARGLRYLSKHPLQVLGLAMLTVVFSFLGPVLQMARPALDDPKISLIFALLAMIPLELYFMPRFLLSVDAVALDHPMNPGKSWRNTFEKRWMRAFAAKLLLYLLFILGATCLLVPGLIIWVTLGWMPYRVLLRGEPVRKAARASAVLMARFWPYTLLTGIVVLAIYGLSYFGVAYFETHFLPDPETPWIRLTHPASWTIDFIAGAMNVWISLTFLALYQRLEELNAAVPESKPQH